MSAYKLENTLALLRQHDALAHTQAVDIDAISTWHMIAAIMEFCAARNISFEDQVAEVRESYADDDDIAAITSCNSQS